MAVPLLTVECWEEGECPARVKSRFFTMDVARRTDGRWIIMELGDGQVAGLPERLRGPALQRNVIPQHAVY